MRKTVAELMSVDFVTVTARMSLEDALALLAESDLTELCVVDAAGRFAGVVTDFDLLKASLNGQLLGRYVESSISRDITVLPVEALIDQVLPLFRSGQCSFAYICHDGQIRGRLSRSCVLKHLAQKTAIRTPTATRSLSIAAIEGQIATLQPREATPPAPQFLAGSVLAGLCVDRPNRHSPDAQARDCVELPRLRVGLQ